MLEALVRLAERLGFGPDYDRTARQALRRSPSRIVAAAMFLALAPVIGASATAAWLLTMLTLELWLRSALERQIAGGPPSLRLERTGASLLMSLSWVGLAVVLWLGGEPGMRIASLGLLAGILLYAHSACSKVPGQFLITGGPADLDRRRRGHRDARGRDPHH